MTNPETTKLRLIQERLKRELDAKSAEELTARRAWEAAWLAYVQARREEGFCAFCEKPLKECKCQFYAAPVEPDQSLWSWLTANARQGRMTAVVNVAPNGDVTLDNLALHDEPPADRKLALDEIVRISEEAGLYDDPSRVLSPHRIDPYRPASTADAPPSSDSTAPNRRGDDL